MNPTNPQQTPDLPRLTPHWTPLTKGVKIKTRRHQTDPCQTPYGTPTSVRPLMNPHWTPLTKGVVNRKKFPLSRALL